MEEVQLNELENYRPTSQLELCRDASLDGSEFIVKTVLDDEARPFLVIDSKTQISFEQALNVVGFGKFQYRLCIICGMGWMADAVEMTLLSYIIQEAREEYELTDFWSSFLGSAVFIGMWLGAMFFGKISDSYGRRVGYLSSTLITFIFSVASSFSPNYWSLVLLRSIVGFGIGGITTPFALFTEFLPDEKRGVYLVLLNAFWTIGSVFSAGLAWALLDNYDWRVYVFCASLPVLVPLSLFFITPESPRYLMISGKPEKAMQVLRNAAKLNGHELGDELELEESKVVEDRGNFRDLIAKGLRLMSFLLCCIWFINTCSYYGIVLLTPQYFQTDNPGSKYMEVFITCLAEFPGVFVAAILINTRGRRQTLALLLATFAIFSLLLIIQGPPGLSTFFACVSRAAMLGSFATIFVYTPEVYPTKVRATGLGACSAVSRLGGVLAPVIAHLGGGLGMKVPLGIFAGFGLLGSILSILLPIETMGRKLEDTKV